MANFRKKKGKIMDEDEREKPVLVLLLMFNSLLNGAEFVQWFGDAILGQKDGG